jgi:hypothetical protein
MTNVISEHEQLISERLMVPLIKDSEPGTYSSWNGFTRFMTEFWNEGVADQGNAVAVSDDDMAMVQVYKTEFEAMSEALEEDQKTLDSMEQAQKSSKGQGSN